MADDFPRGREAGIPVRKPGRSPLEAFREAAAAGRIAVLAGKDHRPFPPRFTDASGQLDVGTEGGQSVVYSATRIERRGDAYTLALVDLPGGGRVLGQVLGQGLADDPAVLIGRAVRLVENGTPFLTFAPEEPA